MAYRIVMIESEAKISIKLNSLVVDKGEGEVWIPLDDISVIVLDNINCSLTARMLSIIASQNIALFISDQTHHPIGLYTSYDNHSRISKMIGFQMKQKESFYDEFWQKVVSTKIDNQRKVLIKLEADIEKTEKLELFRSQILIGDSTNREAHSAKVYFNAMMGTSFSRGNESILLNSGLDYIYSVIRAFIARVCVAYGLITEIGIHHKNEFNRFNLVDDLIEPVRPIADLYTYSLLCDSEIFLPEHRRQLVNFLNHKIVYMGKTMYICNMLEAYVEQYAAFVVGRREYVVFPDVDCYVGDCEDEV